MSQSHCALVRLNEAFSIRFVAFNHLAKKQASKGNFCLLEPAFSIVLKTALKNYHVIRIIYTRRAGVGSAVNESFSAWATRFEMPSS